MTFILCFPEDATVQTPNGTKPMKAVAVGDTVRVVTPEGKVEWSTVCGWLHRDVNSRAAYLRLQTSKRALTVSAAHLVATVEDGRVSFKQASEIREGSTLLEVDNVNANIWGNRVLSVSNVQCAGIYAPLTVSGTIVVDGVGASCYAATRSHTAAHAAMKPMRAMYKHNPEKMATSARAGKHIEGSHRYVDLLARVAGKV